jgi:putative FmdB family regulatory protein
MPTYEYRCKDCGHTFDAYQSFTDDPLTECPECGGVVKKVFGNVGISFKGSGFYKTDSRGGANGKAGAKKADDAAASSSSSSGDGSGSSSSSTSSSSSSDGGSSSSASTKKETSSSSSGSSGS